jgi:uncharacterized protein (TIGR02594 family)
LDCSAFTLATRYIGTRELPGERDNPHILAWLMDAGVADPRQATGLYHDETPWCASFVGHIVRLCALRAPHAPARARSWLQAGLPIDPKDALIGWDVVVLQRGDGLQPGPEVVAAPGHVGFFAGWHTAAGATFEPTAIRVLGGNQGNQVSVATFPMARVLGVRRLRVESAT